MPLFLHGRYDVRAGFQAWSMVLRFVGILVGAHFGVAQAIAGVLLGQLVATASIGIAGRRALRRFPSAPARALDEDRREIFSFVLQSSTATGVISLRTGFAPLLLGLTTSTTQVGFFRVAQAPQSTFAALSSPARMVLLTEQTRDWERGRQSIVLRGVRRYMIVALALSLLCVPPLLVWIPDLIRIVNGARYLPAAWAARLFVLAAAVQLVVGWSKSFAVTIGRPGLRIWTHGLDAVVTLPLVIVLGLIWGAAGAAAAVLAGSCVFAAAWLAVLAGIRAVDSPTAVEAGDGSGEAAIEAEVRALSR